MTPSTLSNLAPGEFSLSKHIYSFLYLPSATLHNNLHESLSRLFLFNLLRSVVRLLRGSIIMTQLPSLPHLHEPDHP